MKKAQRSSFLALFLICCIFIAACKPAGLSLQNDQEQGYESKEVSSRAIQDPDEEKFFSISEIPEYSGEPYVVLEGNQPDFEEDEMTEDSFEQYSELDAMGRCGSAYANVGQDLMPVEERGNIGRVKPTGWHTAKYDIVEGKYLYNRCHLIGYQLTAENANEKNLITGTRYMNVEGMLPFENMVADYVKETDFHVLYRVTPVFEGDDLLAKGVQMEAYSVEDAGEGICFHVFVYNVQPGIQIDYATGESRLESGAESESDHTQVEIRGNSRSKVYHCPGQAAYEEMADSKNLVIFHTEQEAIDAGYRKAKR
ncbi:DNA/RNA non-specific endonuclease [Hominifimenecus sp. rT4P-3]|uniref:DNA/RNA non-specific endonuclease n=1 Tax=Hominifimenecus sp. rT4P-3 TaxID=3242979 RepID=UPI003DA3EFE2